MKEEKVEDYLKDLYGNYGSTQDRNQSKTDFLNGWDACIKYMNSFEEDEEVEVTDEDHIRTNFWFKRKFIQKDSDGKYACRQIDGSVCRWRYIRKILN